MFLLTRRWASCAVLAIALTITLSRAGAAQVSTFEACSQGALNNCATVQLTSQLGVGPGGLNLFQIALQNLGSTTMPNLATSFYSLVLLTGQGPATPGTEVDALVTPGAQNGATISDPSAWSLFDGGDAIFLLALSGNGVGGCAAAAPVNGVGQMGNTCGPNDLITFDFFTSRAFDPAAMTIADIEFAGVSDGNPADACNDAAGCVIRSRPPVTATPEPATLLLVGTGMAGIAGVGLRRRIGARLVTPSEA